MKKFFVLMIIIFLGAFIAGCQQLAVVTSIEIESETSEFDQNFQLSDLNVKVNMSNGTSSTIPLQESMLSSDDLAKFQSPGEHTINVNYLGAVAQFTITITAEPGEDGREIEMDVVEGYIVWRYVGETTWTNLVALSAITGPAGSGEDFEFRVEGEFIQWKKESETTWTDLISTSSLIGPAGLDGKNVTFQVDQQAGFIQWQYVGDTTWNNLIALSLLVGPAGTAGKDVTFRVDTVSGYVQWQYVGDTTWTDLVALSALTGEEGKAIVLRVDTVSGYIQWQYVGDTTWTNLVTLESLQGQSGKQVTFRTDGGFVQWQYVGEDTWTNLIDLASLKGQDGLTPTISINQDGYWVINGVVTEYLASGGGAYIPQKLTVTFDLDGGILPDGVSAVLENIPKGDPIDLPIPTKEGYIFKGWFSGFTVNDGQFLQFMPVVKNMTLYAKWEIDTQPIEEYRYYILQDMLYDFEFMKATATPESILMLTTIYNDSVAYVNNATTTEEMDQLYNSFYMSMQAAYVYDETAQELAEHINNMKGELDGVFQSYIQMLINPLDQEQVNTALEQYVAQITNATSSEEVDTIFASAVTYIQGLTFEEDPAKLQLVRYQLFYQLVSQYNFLVSELESFEPALDATYQLLFTHIEEATTYHQLLAIYLDEVPLLKDAFLIEKIEQLQVELANQYAIFDYAINEADDAALATLFNEASVALAAVVDGNEFEMIFQTFTDGFYQLNYDNLRLEIKVMENHLYQELEWSAQVATQDSFVAMSAIVDGAFARLAVATTFEELYPIHQDILDELFAAFIEDEYKVNLMYSIDKLSERLFMVFDGVSSFLPEGSVEVGLLINFAELYHFYMQFEPTILDAQTLFDEYYAQVFAFQFPFDNTKIADLIVEVKEDFTFQYNLIIDIFGALEPAQETIYVNALAAMEASTSVPEFLNNAFIVFDFLDQFSIVIAKEEATVEMNETYQYYLGIIIEADVQTLNDLLQTQLALLDTVTYEWQVNEVIWEFDNQCYELLTIDPLKQAKQEYTNYLQEHLEELSKMATSDSIIEMQALVVEFGVDLQNTLTADEVYLLYYEYFDLLDAAYVIDPELEQLAYDKEWYLNALWLYTEMMQYTTLDEAAKDKVYDLYYEAIDQMDQATDSFQVNDIYLTYEDLMFVVPFERDVDMVNEYRQGLINDMYYKAYFYLSQFDVVPQDLFVKYSFVKNQIEIAGNPQWMYMQYVDYLNFLDYTLIYAYKDYVTDIANGIYTNISQQTTINSQIVVDEAYQDFIYVIQTSNIKEKIDYALYTFQDITYYIEYDEIKADRISRMEYLTSQLDSLLQTATLESAGTIRGIYDIAIENLRNAVDSEVISDIESQAITDMWNAYLADSAKEALQYDVYQTIHELEQYGYHTINYLDDNLVWYVYGDILDKHIAVILDATLESDLAALLALAKQELELYEQFNLEEINAFRSDCIASMTEALSYVPDPAPYQAAYDAAVIQINNASHPFDIKLIFDEFYDIVTP